MTNRLDGARAKARRAEQHLAELDRLGQRWAETVTYEVRMEPDGPTTLVARMWNPGNATPPRGIALAAGDAIHNLRSALDHLAYQLAVEGGSGGVMSEYPIFESRERYAAQVDRLLEGVGARDRMSIEATQPYHLRDGDAWRRPTGPDDPLLTNAILRLLRRLDNQDKHRLILEGAAEGSARRPSFRGVRAAEGTHPSRSIPIHDGAELFRVESLEPIDDLSMIQVGYRPAFTVIVSELGAPANERVRASIGTLHTAARVVRELIDAFDTDLGEPATGNAEPSAGPHMVLDWNAGGHPSKVGVFVDLGMRRRPLLDFWPEVITAIESASSLGEMWSNLESAGQATGFTVRAIQREAPDSPHEIGVHLVDPSGNVDVWFGTILPLPRLAKSVGAYLAEAVRAVDRAIHSGLERDLGLVAALGAEDREVLAGRGLRS